MKYIIALLLSLMVFTACSSETAETESESPATSSQSNDMTSSEIAETDEATEDTSTSEAATSDQLELTLAELATYNGKDGQPAYIAVDGVVYDVTESDAWKNGKHNGFEAGKDLTEEIKNQSPHGVSKLEGVTAIGVIVE